MNHNDMRERLGNPQFEDQGSRPEKITLKVCPECGERAVLDGDCMACEEEEKERAVGGDLADTVGCGAVTGPSKPSPWPRIFSRAIIIIVGFIGTSMGLYWAGEKPWYIPVPLVLVGAYMVLSGWEE